MEIKKYFINNDGSINLILGQSHFIKTVDDLAEIITTTVPNAKFGIAFCEASGPALIRHEGNDQALTEQAIEILNQTRAGHSFIILLKECFPINILSKVKMCDEIVHIYCATANPLTILTVSDQEGASIIGVIDGVSPRGIETDEDKKVRRDFLRKINYKF